MAGQHILLAEARPNLQHSLGLVLKQAEYRVSLAKTVTEAAAMAKALHNTQDPVALLIVDLDSASPEACRALMHTLPASALAIPYLVLAEEIGDQARDALKNHGCLACLAKPFEPETLLRSVDDALGRLPSTNGHQPGRKPENPSTESPVNQPGEPPLYQGEKSCKTSSCANGFHSCCLPGFW